MLQTTVKSLLAHKRRLFTTALAVALGVAFLAGTLVLNATIGRTLDDLFGDLYRRADGIVRSEAAFNGPQNTGQQRGRFDASLLDRVRGVDGVDVAQPMVWGYTRLIGKDGEPLGNPDMGPPTLGTNWIESAALNPFVLDPGGRAPAMDDEVVIDARTAKEGDFKVGDVATVLLQGPPQQVRIVGTAKLGTTEGLAGATYVMFTQRAAERMVAQPGRLDEIQLKAKSGVSQAELVRRVRAVVPAGLEVLTGEAMVKEVQSEVERMMSFFETFMLVFAVIAMVVLAFMIFNTFSITVAQRTRENGLLRALGASRRQVLGSVVIEATIIGSLASVIGVVLGIGVAVLLKGLLAVMGMDIPTTGTVVGRGTVVMSLVAGVVVTVLASVSPARKAAKVPPIAAMHAETIGSTGYGSKERVIVGLVILGLGVTSLLFGLLGSAGNALAYVGLGMLLVFLGVSVLGRTVSLPLSRVIGWPLPRVRGTSGQLARENAMRNPKRTASSAAALMIGVGLVGFITIMASSTRASVSATVDRAFTGDFVVTSGAGMMGGLDPSFTARVGRLPEIEAATGLRMGSAQVDGSVTMIVAVDPKTAFDIYDVKPRSGSPSDLGADAIAVFEDVAREKNLTVGDTIPVLFATTGEKQMRVALIYGENRPAGDYFLGVAAYEANFGNNYDTQVFIKRAQSVSVGSALAAVKNIATEYPGAKVLDQTGYKAEQARGVNQILALVYVLLALAIVIALLGIGNTLALSIFERTRELGLLRAVGMTRQQLRSTVRWESVIIALQGTALGLVIGVFFGWALVQALGDEGIDQFSLPILELGRVVIIAALAGVFAAIRPARRAARLNVLQAIASE